MNPCAQLEKDIESMLQVSFFSGIWDTGRSLLCLLSSSISFLLCYSNLDLHVNWTFRKLACIWSRSSPFFQKNRWCVFFWISADSLSINLFNDLSLSKNFFLHFDYLPPSSFHSFPLQQPTTSATNFFVHNNVCPILIISI